MYFVSVLDAVESIATCVPKSDKWEEEGPLVKTGTPPPWGDKSSLVWSFSFNSLNARFFSVYRVSEAAALLDQFLHNAGAHSPRWFDCGETGRPKLSEVARMQASRMLVYMAGQYDRYGRAYQSGLFNTPGVPYNDVRVRELERYQHPDDGQRLREIGFDGAEIIQFLTQNGIPHQLSHMDNAQSSQSRSADSISHTVAPPSKEKRNVLDTIIEQAIEMAGGTYKTSDVFLFLKELALDRKRLPFTGVLADDGGLQYWDEGHEPASLTRSRLDNRLIRRWRAMGHTGPRQ